MSKNYVKYYTKSDDMEGRFVSELRLSVSEFDAIQDFDHETAGPKLSRTRHREGARIAFSASANFTTVRPTSNHRVIFTAVHTNIGHVISARSGSMRAPYDGTYMFMFNLLRQNVTLTRQATLWLVRNKMRVASARHSQRSHVMIGDVASTHTGNHVILHLSANDIVWLQLSESTYDGAKRKRGPISYEINFSGYMIW